MTWLTPWIGGIAAAIAVPSLIILYFLKLRRRDVEISTTLLWRKSIEDLQANAPFQRLRKNLLLFLQLLALAGVLFALAQPQIKAQALEGTKNVILIDRSASMTAEDEKDSKGGKQTRLAAAKKEAIALIESMREGSVLGKTFGTTDDSDEAMVIAFDRTAEVRQTFTHDKRILREAIEAITPVEGPTSIDEAIRLARAHAPAARVRDPRTGESFVLEGMSGGVPLTMHLWSDGKISDADKAKPNSEDTFIYHRAGGESAPNVGITGLRAERSYEDPTKLSIFVALENNETTIRAVDAELLVEGVPVGIKGVEVPAATSTPISRERAEGVSPDEDRKIVNKLSPGIGGVVFQLERAEGALVQVNLRQPGSGDSPAEDVLAVDNRAWLVVPPSKKMAVALVTRGNLFLPAVLQGLPLSRLDQMTPEDYEGKLRAGQMGGYDVVVLDKYVPVNNLGPLGLPPGRFLIFGAVPPSSSGITDKGKGPPAGFIDWKRDHPALRAINLDPVLIAESRLVEVDPRSSAVVLANTDKGPAIIELSSVETHAVVVAFDPAESTWPFDLSFVVFTASGVPYVGEEISGGPLARGLTPASDSTLSDHLPAGVERAKVELPNGDSQEIVPAPDGRITFGPINRTGVYRVSWTGQAGPTDIVDGSKASRLYAANLLDGSESEVHAAPELELASRVVQARTDTTSQADRKLWPYLILVALLVVMFEWYIYNRKVYI